MAIVEHPPAPRRVRRAARVRPYLAPVHDPEPALVRPYVLRTAAEQAEQNRARRAGRVSPDRVLAGLHALGAEEVAA